MGELRAKAVSDEGKPVIAGLRIVDWVLIGLTVVLVVGGVVMIIFRCEPPRRHWR